MKPYILRLYETSADGTGAYKWPRIALFFSISVAVNVVLYAALSAVFDVTPLIDGRGFLTITFVYICITALICYRQRKLHSR